MNSAYGMWRGPPLAEQAQSLGLPRDRGPTEQFHAVAPVGMYQVQLAALEALRSSASLHAFLPKIAKGKQQHRQRAGL